MGGGAAAPHLATHIGPQRIIRAQATQEHVIVGGVYIFQLSFNSSLLAFEYSALIILVAHLAIQSAKQQVLLPVEPCTLLCSRLRERQLVHQR
jgi:hypothetical protein